MIYRVAIIGCGKIGGEFDSKNPVEGIYSHAGAYSACPKTELVAICDIDKNKLEKCGERWNISARYHNAKQMLHEQKPDIVSICTPDPSHYELIQAAVTTPGVRAVLAEKPLAIVLEQAKEIVSLANERRIILAVNYIRRFHDNYRKLKEFIKSGGIGPIQTINGYYTKGTIHNGTHWFDLARFLVGEVVRVWGYDVRKEDENDPTLDAFLEFDCGAGAHLHGCEATAFSLFEMDLIGTQGRIRIIESGRLFEIYKVAEDPNNVRKRNLNFKEKTEGSSNDLLLSVVENIVDCLQEGCEPRCSGSDGVEALRIALAVRESVCSGRIINLSKK